MAKRRRKLKIKTKEKKGKITTFGRRRLSRKQFALPPSPEEKRRGIKGRYPIDTIERARNALARVSAYGTPEEKAKVRRAVYRKYPGLKKRKQKRQKGRKKK